MDFGKIRRRALLSWLSLILLVALVCALGVLQYRWIGEISQAEQKKIQDNLQSSLSEVSRDFNLLLNSAVGALSPGEPGQSYEGRYTQWRDSTTHPKLFNRIALAQEEDGRLTLRLLDLQSGSFVPAEWPEAWSMLKVRLTSRPRRGPDGPGGFPGTGGPEGPDDAGGLIEIPASRDFDDGGRDWLLLEVDRSYVSESVLPELLARHLGRNYQAEYEVSLVPHPRDSGTNADASVAIFDVAPQMPGRGGPGPGGPPPRRGPGPPRELPRVNRTPPGDPGRGRWQLSIHLKAGSLEAVVARARWRNLGVSAAVLLLLIATGGALLRLSRQAQRLADAEMEFVASVSHELRTPVTVIRTAAFNLRGKLATQPDQVERYGALIQEESEKLTAIVEQVLCFASAKRGQVIRERMPVSVESLIADSLESSRVALEQAQCRVEKRIEPGLPAILGDSMALRHALQNLIQNAMKYGMKEGNWIGIFASTVAAPAGSAVEIRIEDKGPGIPPDEQAQIFEAFFRGKKAVRDQVHGTGLGLNLVKRIVEAHGGTVDVESRAGAGTSFIVRIPTRPPEYQDEFAHSLG